MSEMQYSLFLEQTVYTKEQLLESPFVTSPQIALAGRSNVGKSSLINALSGRRQLAKVSSTPGKTASINFYRVEPGGFFLVDLPGYGYAQRSKTERKKWAELINDYLNSRANILALAVLLDCRLSPQDVDIELISYARSLGLPLLPILTKADKCSQKERAIRQRDWQALLAGEVPQVTSAQGPAQKRIGLDKLWRRINDIFAASTPDMAGEATQDSCDGE